MRTSLAGVIPGWTHEVAEALAPRVAAGCALENARLLRHAFVLAHARSWFDRDGLVEWVELLDPVDSLETGAVRAEAEARVRADKLRAERDWKELSVGGARAMAPFTDAPFLAVRKIGGGDGIDSIYVRVAVLPIDPRCPLDLALVRAIGLDAELASYLAGLATERKQRA